jgi:NADPH:quinone reductase-like Zn-dependent oxidoreductase
VLPRNADLANIPPVDGVFDAVPVGPTRATAALVPGGTAVFTRPPTPASDGRHHFETVHVRSDPAALGEMSRRLAHGELRTRVAVALPLDEAAQAHELAERGGMKGKIVLRI